MRLKSFAFKNHNVLGNVHLDLLKDQTCSPLESIPDTTIELAVDNVPANNQFTFIIGENGVGKSFLFRTVTLAMNLGSSVDPKLYDYQSFNSEDARYGTKLLIDGAISPLRKMGVHMNNQVIVMDPINDHGNDFLRKHDGQLILITSTVEKKIVHRNSRFRSFNHQSSVNDTNYLFLRALFKNYRSDRMQRLNKLLGAKPNAVWKVRYRLPIDYEAPTSEGKYFVMLDVTKDAFIHDFLRVFRDLKRDDKGDLTTDSDRSKIDISVVESLYRSGSFFKLYFDHNGSDADFFHQLHNSKIIGSLLDFMKSIEDTPHKTVAGNFEVTEQQLRNWEIDLDLNNLSLFEINILATLVEHRAAALDIFLDDIPLKGMSSGQVNMIRLFSYFADMPLTDKPENCIVFFDEPENSLHPKWQQEFPANFRAIVEKVYDIKNSHFIFATHSPVLIMKAAQNEDTDVIKFYREQTGDLKGNIIEHVNAYSIEEVLLDEFKINYRSQQTEVELKKFLDTAKASLPAHDPINSIKSSFDLKQKINALYQKTHSEK